MDDLDGRVGEQVVERVVRPSDTERLGPRGTTFRCAPEDAPDLDADPAQGLDVDRADEARPDDGRTEVGDPNAGQTTENLDSITAVVLGGTSLFGGRGTIIGTLIGALIVGVFRNGLTLIGVQVIYQYLVTGILVILAVSVDQLLHRRNG